MSDTEIRTPHPARFSQKVLDKIAELCDPSWQVLDPMAGPGGVHWLSANKYVAETVGVEIEPEWANENPKTICASVFDIDQLFHPGEFDAVVVSPAFGNRLADNHDAKEVCKQCNGTGLFLDRKCERCGGAGRNKYRRITYRHTLGRPLHPDNSGSLQWGKAYQEWHQRAWAKVVPLIKPGGVFILNCKDHIRNHEIQPVTIWHMGTLANLGLVGHVNDMYNVDTPGMRYGANYAERVPEGDWVVVLRKP